MLAVVAAWLAGLADPVFWPESAFARFLGDTHVAIAYFIWCGVAHLVLSVILRVLMPPDRG